jgi:hypothetical protein
MDRRREDTKEATGEDTNRQMDGQTQKRHTDIKRRRHKKTDGWTDGEKRQTGRKRRRHKKREQQ